jgi:hypothetical protein
MILLRFPVHILRKGKKRMEVVDALVKRDTCNRQQRW